MTPTPEKNSWHDCLREEFALGGRLLPGKVRVLEAFISEVESQARREEQERIKNIFTSKKGLNSEFDSFLDEALNLITLADLKNTPQ